MIRTVECPAQRRSPLRSAAGLPARPITWSTVPRHVAECGRQADPSEGDARPPEHGGGTRRLDTRWYRAKLQGPLPTPCGASKRKTRPQSRIYAALVLSGSVELSLNFGDGLAGQA